MRSAGTTAPEEERERACQQSPSPKRVSTLSS
jgi:hypothetical protein